MSPSALDALEEHLAQAQRLAIIGTLAAGVAHEINNILTPVLSYAHLARSRSDDEDLRRKAFDKIIAGVESACEVAQAMLNFSSGQDEQASAEVGAALKAALGCLARDPAKDRIEMDTRIAPDTWVSIRPHALQQVFLNLIINASHALRGRPGRITVSAEVGPQATTRIEVADNGPGIAPEVIERLFDPFVSTRSSKSADSEAEAGGSGLGLMVTRHLIESAGGTITADSSADNGARFTITLPTAVRACRV